MTYKEAVAVGMDEQLAHLPVHGTIDEDDLVDAVVVVHVVRRELRGPRPEQPGANAVDGNRKSERQHVQLQIAPSVHRPRRPNPFANLKYNDQCEERSRLVIFDAQCHVG